MIEIPRAALTAHQIAEQAEFFSFGSNDLTQMTFGYSRDDVGTFLPSYMREGILLDEPFVTIDTEGVGQLIKMTVEKGRSIKPDLKIGVCGEHGGDPRSVRFFANDEDAHNRSHRRRPAMYPGLFASCHVAVWSLEVDLQRSLRHFDRTPLRGCHRIARRHLARTPLLKNRTLRRTENLRCLNRRLYHCPERRLDCHFEMIYWLLD